MHLAPGCLGFFNPGSVTLDVVRALFMLIGRKNRYKWEKYESILKRSMYNIKRKLEGEFI